MQTQQIHFVKHANFQQKLNNKLIYKRLIISQKQRRYVSETENPITTKGGPLQQQPDPLAEEMMEKLKADQMHLFDDVGIDPNLYENVVDFRDPVTKYDNIQGYIFNIQMLKNVFSPEYIMHDIRKTGENEVTTRWTMVMPFFLGRIDPIKNFYQPKLQFTGTSVMGYNPNTKKFNKHWDFWDSVENNEYLSIEGVVDIFSQLTNLSTKPAEKYSPKYTTFIRKKESEIRKYDATKMLSIEVDESNFLSSSDLSKIGENSLKLIQKYFNGENEEKIKIQMTTPIFLVNLGDRYRFNIPIGPEVGDKLPQPLDEKLHVRETQGFLFGVISFNGVPNFGRVEQKKSQLVKELNNKGLKTSDNWLFARYNDDSTNPLQRTNEVLVPILSELDLWAF